MKAMLNGIEVDVEILDLEESHDVPGYGEWNCEVTFPDGHIEQGTVWGDEHNYDLTSLTLEDYDPTPYCSGCKAKEKKHCHCGPISPDD